MRYKLILLDADRTLFDFEKAQRHAFDALMAKNKIATNENLYELYCKINNECWRMLERGLITKDSLQVKRFERFFEAAGFHKIDAACANVDYIDFLSRQTFLMDGAYDLCKELAGRFTVTIATNGIERAQLSRVRNSAVSPFIEYVAISETVGFLKPDPRFFDYAMRLSGFEPDEEKESTIILGDSLSADICGGNQFGIATCWFNPEGAVLPDMAAEHRPDFTIRSLSEFRDIVK